MAAIVEAVAVFPDIETLRTNIRQLRAEDGPALMGMTDPALAQKGAMMRMDDPIPFISANETGYYRVLGVWRREGDLIGCVNAHFTAAFDLEIGFWFATAVQGQGYAGESLATILPILDKLHPGRRIIADTAKTNERSLRLLGRLGFVPVDQPARNSESVVMLWQNGGE